MEVLYQRERATANELMALLPGDPSNSTVRTLLRILEEKKEVKKIEEDGRYVYFAAYPREKAAKNALSGIVDTFFRGSVSSVVATLLNDKGKLSEEELDHLQTLIDKAREEGK